MSETQPEPTVPEPAAEPPKAKSLEESLAALDEDTRKTVLDQLSKARREAAGYREKLREAEPLARKARELETANQTEAERLQATARAAEDRAAAAVQRAAAAEIRSALLGEGYTSDHAAALIEDMNVGRYVGEDGQVDTEAVRAKYGPLAPQPGSRAPRPNPAQGRADAPKTLAEQIAEASAQSDGSRKSTQRLLRLKSAQLLDVRRQG